MKTYWDHSERERADMTEEEVTRLLDFELMQKGILKPKPLVVLPVVPPAMPKKTYARVRCDGRHGTALDVVFHTVEDAKVFLALLPALHKNDWETRSEYVSPMLDTEVFFEELTDAGSVNLFKSELKKIAANLEENRRAEAQFSKESQEVERATRGVWEDWRSCRNTAVEMRRIADTEAEYEALAGDNDAMVVACLLKTFGDARMQQYAAWASTGALPESLAERPATEKKEQGDDLAF
jgi:hypothetical protein